MTVSFGEPFGRRGPSPVGGLGGVKADPRRRRQSPPSEEEGAKTQVLEQEVAHRTEGHLPQVHRREARRRRRQLESSHE